MKAIHSLFATTVLTISALSGVASAQVTSPDVPGHPRVNEVNQREANQENRTAAGVADGQINGRQAARDEKADANIERRESVDEAKHGGHLTKREQTNLNRSENRNSARIHRQRAQ